ncbi:DUF4268 domain-containing protein [Dietzia kunjamensis]|uniref:DUF4268 domain-containing protein n=1 Tax=Dietzia kunjamensis TaxID=322509 RepID=UPI0022B54952|nr:DUF4268 domain-containing protein [Dietzia kunjamensis]MCZ4657034.1 DUF4268 domain-containing protein [Dietzia kunjamensis]
MTELGKLEQVDLREVWRHEAADFTQWLALPENLDQLADSVLGGRTLTATGTEVNVGNYKADIVAVDSEDRVVVIENQLEQTNHDHLGKVITYAAGKQAEVIIWIVKEAREEHENAINWLNEHTDDQVHFFLLQIEAWRIGQSPPAPRFNIVAKPNDWLKVVKQSTAPGSPSDLKLQQQQFFEELRQLGQKISPNVKRWPEAPPRHWYDIRVGSSKGHVTVTLHSQKKHVGVEFYANQKDTFFELERDKGAIEDALGLTCDWHELPERNASRIMTIKDGDFRDPTVRTQLLKWAATTADNFARVFTPYL